MDNSAEHATGSPRPGDTTFYSILFIGFVIATTLYGVTLLQGLYYFRTYTKDSWNLKLLTLVILFLDTASTVLQAQYIYFYMIQNFGNYAELAYGPLTLRIESSIPTLTVLLVQSFYIHQIWKISRNKYYVIVLEILVLVAFALGFVVFVNVVGSSSVATGLSRTVRVVGSIPHALYTFIDIMITASLCWLLHSRRTGIKRTEKLVDRLIILAIDRGLVTAIAQFCHLILNAPFPGKLWFFAVHESIAKLYTNSYLGMLNVRGYSKTIGGETTTVDDTAASMRFADGSLSTAGVRSNARPLSRFESHDPESLTKLQPSTVDQSTSQSVYTEDGEHIIPSIPVQVIQRSRITGRDVSGVDFS